MSKANKVQALQGKGRRETLETRYVEKSEGLNVERIGGMSMNSWADILKIILR